MKSKIVRHEENDMTKKPEHTALPLPIERKHGEYFTRVFFCANGYPLLYLNDRPDAEGFEELITRACNSHYELVDALALFLKIYKLENGITEGTIPCVDIISVANEALAKARGEA